ncbi:MAG: VWA domain-containing protein [Sandaracinaceae bacterium]|nr:VWA domain-containing protein [Sandaracinaceae bacterium]
MSRARSMNLGALALAVLLGAAAAVAIGLQVWDHDLAWEFGGERYEFLASRALVLLGVLPLLGWVATLSLADLPPLQKWLGVLLRAVLMAALVLGLARLSRTTDSARISTVFLVDVSDSVTDEAIAEARGKVQAALDARGEHDVQLITFARHARVVPLAREATELPERLARHGDEAHTDAGAGSNMAAALQLAYGLFPPGHLRRAVLLSDGGQTEGDLLAEASRAREFDVRLFHHVYTQGAPEEVAVRDMTVPEQLRVGDPFPVRARVFSNYAAEARVRLYQGETLNGLDSVRDVTLTPGDNEIEFQSVVRVAGPVTYRLELQPRGEDRFPANNRFETTAVVPGKPSVLYVEGAAGRANYLSRALAAGEFDVDVRTPRSIPTSSAELERFDFFMLSDVSADEVSMSQMDAIERYVRDQGGGFMMAGGESGFGLGGWQGSRMERLLPVRMDAERRRNQPSLALALVIDRSGSMAGQKLELAKEAARATAEMLGADDYIMVVGFDSEPERIVRMQSARNRLRIVRDISRMTARGGTNIFPALDMAYQDLAVTRARVKHVIVLTDGQAPESGIAELVQVMRAEGITVTSVGLGSDVNRVLLEQVASLGGGRSYFTSDPHNVPRIFMRETTTVARSAAVEEYFQPMVVQNADFLRGIDIASGAVPARLRGDPPQAHTRAGHPAERSGRAHPGALARGPRLDHGVDQRREEPLGRGVAALAAVLPLLDPAGARAHAPAPPRDAGHDRRGAGRRGARHGGRHRPRRPLHERPRVHAHGGRPHGRTGGPRRRGQPPGARARDPRPAPDRAGPLRSALPTRALRLLHAHRQPRAPRPPGGREHRPAGQPLPARVPHLRAQPRPPRARHWRHRRRRPRRHQRPLRPRRRDHPLPRRALAQAPLPGPRPLPPRPGPPPRPPLRPRLPPSGPQAPLKRTRTTAVAVAVNAHVNDLRIAQTA